MLKGMGGDSIVSIALWILFALVALFGVKYLLQVLT